MVLWWVLGGKKLLIFIFDNFIKMLEHPKKPEIITWISEEIWEKLSLKEKDYFIFRYELWYKKEQLMRALYLTSNWSYKNFLYRIKKVTKNATLSN